MSPWIAAAASLFGVIIGAFTSASLPVIESWLGNKVARGDRQRELADRILGLWQDCGSVVEALASESSKLGRNTLLLGVRLEDDRAREACMVLVDAAGADAERVEEVWADMVDAVAAVYRGSV